VCQTNDKFKTDLHEEEKKEKTSCAFPSDLQTDLYLAVFLVPFLSDFLLPLQKLTSFTTNKTKT